MGIMIGVLVALGAGLACADLCAKCKGSRYIMSVGTCSDCGAATSSGALKLCKACSTRLGECEHCRSSIGAPVPPPAPTNAAAQAGAASTAAVDRATPGPGRKPPAPKAPVVPGGQP